MTKRVLTALVIALGAALLPLGGGLVAAHALDPGSGSVQISTSVTATAAPTYPGDPGTLLATISPAEGTAAGVGGSITVSADGWVTSVTGTVTDGVASIPLPAVDAPGVISLSVAYSGDGIYTPSATISTWVVSRVPAHLDVIWPASQTFGNIDGNVQVLVSPDASVSLGVEVPALAGAVRLTAGGVAGDPVDLQDGAAALPLPATLGGGPQDLTVEYLGDDWHAPATATNTLTVERAPTALAITAPFSVLNGDPYSVTVGVTSPNGPVSPGSVRLSIAGTDIVEKRSYTGTPVTFDLTATHQMGVFITGPITLNVTFSGNNDFLPSTQLVAIPVDPRPTTTSATIRASLDPNASFEIHARVDAGRGNLERMTGSVIAEAGPDLPSFTAPLFENQAVIVIPNTLPAGQYRYTVRYLVSGRYLPSESGPVSFTIGRVPSDTSVPGASVVRPTQTTIPAGGLQTVTVREVPVGETVHFFLFSDPIYLGSAVAGTDGVATFSFSVPADLPPGRHRIEARTDTRIESVWITVTAPELARTGAAGAPGPAAAAAPALGVALAVAGVGVLAGARLRRRVARP